VLYLANAFSLNMLNLNRPWQVNVVPMSIEEVKDFIKIAQSNNKFKSAVGHQDLADILTNMLGLEIPCERMTVTLTPDDTLIVAQYVGPRLSEGTTTLPEGAQIQFVRLFIR